MTKAEILEQFPEAAAEIVADAAAEKMPCGKTCDKCGKKDHGAENACALVTATMGADVGDQFKALVESGISAEQAVACKVKITTAEVVNDENSRAAILTAITEASPEGLNGGKAVETEVADKAAAVAAMVSGGSR